MDEKRLLVGGIPRSDKRVHGIIHAYSDAVRSGMIIADSKFYLFSRKDWLSEEPPVTGLPVLFTADGGNARSVVIKESKKKG